MEIQRSVVEKGTFRVLGAAEVLGAALIVCCCSGMEEKVVRDKVLGAKVRVENGSSM